MPAIIHATAGPRGTRTDRLVATYRAANREIGSTLVLTPTARHADQVRMTLGTCIGALVFDLQTFADELLRVNKPELQPNSDTDRRLAIESVLAELRDRELPYFQKVATTRGFIENAYGYVSELTEAGVFSQSWPDATRARKKQTPDPHAQAFRIFEHYRKRLAVDQRVDPAERQHLAARLWEEGKLQPFDRVRTVFLHGFVAFTMAQQNVLAAIRQTVDHLWLGLPICGGGRQADFEHQWVADAIGLSDPVEIRLEPESKAEAAEPEASRHLIEAAGEVGEARLVARRVRALIVDGTRAERILIVDREFTSERLALFREVLDEYDIPYNFDLAESLARAPAVAFLLRTRPISEEGWEFSRIAAVLRSSFFRPNWPELRNDPELPAAAEALLRALGETRGRDAMLKAVATWEREPPEPLDDEDIEETQRKKKHQLAIRCRPFLERFFKIWDVLDHVARAEIAVGRLKEFAGEIGLSNVRSSDARDLARLWRELDRWARREGLRGGRKPLRAGEFDRVLEGIGQTTCCERNVRGEGVALLSAKSAAGLDCDYLFLVGLGEGSWPDLSPPVSLLDDAERMRLRKAHITVSDPTVRLRDEQFLFEMLVASPRRELVLSYSAVDERGQELLKCSFLRELLAKSPIEAESRTSQRMLLDGYFDREPMSQAEQRVRLTHDGATNGGPRTLSRDLTDNLSRARSIASARFDSETFGAFDGELRHPSIAEKLASGFGPNKVFSATALDNYVACPFRFLLQHVLKLELLEDPSEEVAHTRRGSAFHRALARFHRHVEESLRENLSEKELPEIVTQELVDQVGRAVEEYAKAAPSRATAELWRLEGERLERAARRYRQHWQDFRGPWREKSATPTPHQFEAAFGLPVKGSAEALVISVGEVEVRIGGRIDRVDLATLKDAAGFWVIDYKTGRATSYSATQVKEFEKLQLPLYALAVERVLLKGKPSRPLGLAYWLVTDTGPKGVLPAGKGAAQAWLADAKTWPKFREQLEAWVATLATHIRAGDFPLAPRSEHCTDTCSFGPVCRISQSRNTGKVFELELPLLKGEPGA